MHDVDDAKASALALAANGAVLVDAQFQTNVPSIHAIGDVIQRYQLTPVALAEGMVVAPRFTTARCGL